MPETSKYRDRNSTADRALAILEMFTDTHLVVSAVEIADKLGVARSTAYRYVETLTQSGFLAEDGHAGFILGGRIIELARLARRSYGLSQLAVPAMRRLAERFHQTVLLTKTSRNAVICLEREESTSQYVRLSYERGTVLPLNAGASALVLLAWRPENEVRTLFENAELERFTEASLVEPDDLVERLAQIRAAGYSITRGEVDPEAMGIAAPIFGSDGAVVAAISIVLLRSRVAEDTISDMVEAILASSVDLTSQVARLDD